MDAMCNQPFGLSLSAPLTLTSCMLLPARMDTCLGV